MYLVEMLRFGNRGKHSYVLGVYSTRNNAMESINEEEEYRGGKYTGEITKIEIDIKIK